MEAPGPLYTAALFAPLHDELLALLRGLAPDDWHRPTAAGAWRVRDVVAHLVDGDLRKLSVYRDGHALAPPDGVAAGDYGALVAYLNRLNAEWVGVARRLSPRVLVELLGESGGRVAELVAALPPHGESIFAVAWAGEARSENWMDAGREYTERWHHQQQIRDAVGAPGLTAPRWLHPVLEISARALPAAYASVPARDGAAVVLEVTGEAGGTWSVVASDGREGDDGRDGGNGSWTLRRGAAPSPAAAIRMDADDAWRMFFNALPAEALAARVEVRGDAALGTVLLRARAVMV